MLGGEWLQDTDHFFRRLKTLLELANRHLPQDSLQFFRNVLAFGFRHVLARYNAQPLSEALITGIKVGHPDMPLFEMNPKGVDSLVAYLKSIQTPETEAP